MTLAATAMLVAGLQALITVPKLRRVAALAGGCLMLLAVLSPLVCVDLEDWTWPAFSLDSLPDMEESTQKQVNGIIKQSSEAYILDKADELNAMVSAEVEVMPSENGLAIPYAVTLTGLVSARQKEALAQAIAEDLQIPAERQRWKTI